MSDALLMIFVGLVLVAYVCRRPLLRMYAEFSKGSTPAPVNLDDPAWLRVGKRHREAAPARYVNASNTRFSIPMRTDAPTLVDYRVRKPK